MNLERLTSNIETETIGTSATGLAVIDIEVRGATIHMRIGGGVMRIVVVTTIVAMTIGAIVIGTVIATFVTATVIVTTAIVTVMTVATMIVTGTTTTATATDTIVDVITDMTHAIVMVTIHGVSVCLAKSCTT